MVKNTMVRKMGRIRGVPRLMAIPEPILAPIICPAAITKTYGVQDISPCDKQGQSRFGE